MTKRLFVAIDLPDVITRTLATLDPHIPGVHWVLPAQMHLTLAFFGQASEGEELRLRNRLGEIRFASFFLPIAGLGQFPPKGSPKVIWIGMGSAHPHLFQIHKRVQEAALSAGLAPDLRSWHPHVTLARCRDAPSQRVQKFLKQKSDFDAGMIRVEEFCLYSSKPTPAGSFYIREQAVACVAGD